MSNNKDAWNSCFDWKCQWILDRNPIPLFYHIMISKHFQRFLSWSFVQNYNLFYSIINMTACSIMSSSFDRSKSMWYNGLIIWINLLTNQSRLYCTDTNEFFYHRCNRVPLRYIQSPCLPKAFQKCFISLATCVIIIHLRSLSFVLQSLCKKFLTWYFHLKPIMSHYEWYQLF